MIARRLAILLVVSVLFWGNGLPAPAAPSANLTVTVNRTGDGSDLNPGDGLCDASVNAGEQCSLRAAMEELNAQGTSATPHRIEFNISGSGPFTISPGSELPIIQVPVEIDATTQSGASCPTGDHAAANLMIIIDGSNAGANSNGLHLGVGSNNSSVRGLVIGDFSGRGVYLDGNDSIVRCNYIGVGVDGASDFSNDGPGLLVAGNRNTIGGQGSPSQRNVISRNFSGIDIAGDENIVRNNFIGTMATGITDLGNMYSGLYVSGNNNTIGGVQPLSRNIFGGNSGGIRINTGANNTIKGNFIGVAVDGVTPLPNFNGIEIYGDATGNLVGGTDVAEWNLIAYNLAYGVALDANVTGIPVDNQISGNAIFANGELGIDLGQDGFDTNDFGDIDTGENGHQNYPVLTSTTFPHLIRASLTSIPLTNYHLDLYVSDDCDPSGYGEGQRHIGIWQTSTDFTGTAVQLIDLSGLVANGDILTATATDPAGNTSEFSSCLTLSGLPTPMFSPTRTQTSTFTATPTQTTLPPTHTPTPTWTSTVGPSPTPTGTNTPTFTPTATVELPTNAPTATITPEPSPTPTPTVDPSVTPEDIADLYWSYLPFVQK